MPTLQIDAEFAARCPKLSDEEEQFLRAGLQRDGCQDAVTYWAEPGKEPSKCPVVDGHNRYRICTELGIDFPIKGMEFPSRESVLEWIILNQLGRRNLSEIQKSVLRVQLTMGKRTTQSGENTDKLSVSRGETSRAVREVAQQTGVSERTVYRDKKTVGTLDRLGQKSHKLRDAAVDNKIARQDAMTLADAPVEVLKEVEAASASDLRAAAKGAAKAFLESGEPPSSTGPVVRIKALSDMNELAGKLVRAKTAALEACGGKSCQWAFAHSEAIRHHLNNLFEEIVSWTKEAEKRKAA